MSITADTNRRSKHKIKFAHVLIKAYLSKAAGTEGGLRARLLAQWAHTGGWSSSLSPWASTGPGTNSESSPSLREHTWEGRVRWKVTNTWVLRQPSIPNARSRWDVRLTSPDGCYTGRCRSQTHRPQSPASGAATRRSPAPGGTDARAATHSPAAAGRPETPAGDGHGSRPSGHIAAGMGVLPGEKNTSYKHTYRLQLTILFISD